MNKLRLINYRGFEDTGEVELRPITILVGANSSGKSSFLKFFPLLQQSIGIKVNGMFLWDGENVDFKDFKNTVRNGEGELQFDFVIGKLQLSRQFVQKKHELKDVNISVTLAALGDNYDYLKSVGVEYEKVKIKYSFTPNGECTDIVVNSLSSKDFKEENILVETDNNLFPSLSFKYEKTGMAFEMPVSPLSVLKLQQIIKGKEIIEPIEILEYEIRERNHYFTVEDARKKAQADLKNGSDELLAKLTDIYLYRVSGIILRIINEYFSQLAKSFSYVLPLRTIVQRYYRFQNRDVDQIDPDGGNMAIFLCGLNDKQLKSYNDWLWNIFHFKISVKRSEGHVEMLLHEEGKDVRNLVDVGFGYTQVLPILSIIWKSIYKRSKMSKGHEEPVYIAIEQPELHLHPRFQACFARMLAAAITDCRKKNHQLCLIIETHSETIMNEIGNQIESNNLSNEDVNVVLFGADREGMNTYVHTTTFSEDGVLNEWPFGFFADDDVYRN